jgi:hypothetical protein
MRPEKKKPGGLHQAKALRGKMGIKRARVIEYARNRLRF